MTKSKKLPPALSLIFSTRNRKKVISLLHDWWERSVELKATHADVTAAAFILIGSKLADLEPKYRKEMIAEFKRGLPILVEVGIQIANDTEWEKQNGKPV